MQEKDQMREKLRRQSVDDYPLEQKSKVIVFDHRVSGVFVRSTFRQNQAYSRVIQLSWGR